MALKNVHAAIDRSPVVASCCLHDDCSRYAGQCCRNLEDQTERWVKRNQTIELTQYAGKITGTFRGPRRSGPLEGTETISSFM